LKKKERESQREIEKKENNFKLQEKKTENATFVFASTPPARPETPASSVSDAQTRPLLVFIN
jgi:hypothetical protein